MTYPAGGAAAEAAAGMAPLMRSTAWVMPSWFTAPIASLIRLLPPPSPLPPPSALGVPRPASEGSASAGLVRPVPSAGFGVIGTSPPGEVRPAVDAAGSVSAGFTPVGPVPVSPGVLAGAAGLVSPGLVSAGSVRLGVVVAPGLVRPGLVRPGLVSAGLVSDDEGLVSPPGVVSPPGEVSAGLAPPRLPSPPPPRPGMLRPDSPGICTPNWDVIC
ncbi:hypothetical protein DYE20_00860 [[Mycobacterium] chelonae subsp. gwanakae]|nr:hypothetical protein DYE20_00860 [[Mycobacterium] chelonae subsp. gwanakae]